MYMMKNKVVAKINENEALDMIMAIIGEEKEAKPIKEVTGEVTVYDGRGHAIEINGKKTAKGYQPKKRGKKASSAKDLNREALTDACEVLLNRLEQFTGKVHRNVKDGVVVRMADADYAIKAGGHATCEFDINAEDFAPVIDYSTRGKIVNHSGAIAKSIVEEIQNEFSKSNLEIKNAFGYFEGENSIAICQAKASGIRVQVAGCEFTVKISKKRTRCVI